MESGRKKSQQNSRERVRAQINWFLQYESCLTHPNSNLSALHTYNHITVN